MIDGHVIGHLATFAATQEIFALDCNVTRRKIRAQRRRRAVLRRVAKVDPSSASIPVLQLLDFAHRHETAPSADIPADGDDLVLVSRLALDDGQALAVLMQRYWRAMVAFAYDKLRSQDMAEEVVQETFVRVWERRRHLRLDTSPRAYLYRVLRNLIADDFRRRRLRERFSFILGVGAPEHPPSPIAVLEGSEFASAAERAIAALPERRRDVFVLAHLHGLSYREVAETLGITPRTVANHMTLALTQLRTSLAAFTRRPR